MSSSGHNGNKPANIVENGLTFVWCTNANSRDVKQEEDKVIHEFQCGNGTARYEHEHARIGPPSQACPTAVGIYDLVKEKTEDKGWPEQIDHRLHIP